MKIMIAKADKRAREEGKDTMFFHHSLKLPFEKIQNFKRRKLAKNTNPVSPSAGGTSRPLIIDD